MLQTEYMEGHQLSVHTWASVLFPLVSSIASLMSKYRHPALTTMTNEQIIAELGWTKKIIKDVTGVTPNVRLISHGCVRILTMVRCRL